MSVLAKRVLEMAPSATLGMSQRSREMQERGIDVISLSVGEPDFNTPEVIKQAGIDAINNNFTHYPPVPGYMDLRKAICAKLTRDNKLTYSPNQIIVSNGGKHAIINVLLAMINPGDEVIIPAPCWVSYPEMVKFVEGTPVLVHAGIEDDFKITPEKLEAAITPKTKLLIFNSPSNPTGMVYSREELKAIAEETGMFNTISDDDIAANVGRSFQDVTALRDPFSGLGFGDDLNGADTESAE